VLVFAGADSTEVAEPYKLIEAQVVSEAANWELYLNVVLPV
jgi:hypothetical protein